MYSVAEILVDALVQLEVTHAFGIPGKSVVPLLLELEKKNIQFVLSRHESGAGFEASGYALMNTSLGVAIGTSGPGGTNLLTAAGQAKAFHLPVLFITGHPSMRDTGKSLGQDSTFFGTDLVKMFEPVTLFSARVERGDLFQIYFLHAVEKALYGRKGPVHLSIPYDIFMEKSSSFDFKGMPILYDSESSDLENIMDTLNHATRPVLFIGKGVHLSKAYDEVRIISEYWNIPVMTTPGGKGAFISNHPLSLGGFGLGGTDEAIQYLKSGVDVMIVVGSTLSDMTLAGFEKELWPKSIIQFDINVDFAGKILPLPTRVIPGDAKINLKKLIKLANATDSSLTISKEKKKRNDSNDSTKDFISATEAMETLRDCLPDHAILFGDDGSHSFYAIKNFEIINPGTFFFDDVFAAMGHAIGYSIGAKLAKPATPIICLTGDGCTLMHGTEFSTAANYNIPVIFVVLNNGRLDMVEKGMFYYIGKTVGTTYHIPANIKQFSESLGVQAFRCQTREDIVAALTEALNMEKPTVLEILVDPCEIPPTLSRE